MGKTINHAVIPNADSQSGIIDLREFNLVALQTPAAWTTANITFLGSLDGVTYCTVKDSGGTEVAVTTAASTSHVLNPETFGGFRYLKVRSGTAASPVNQGAERVVLLGLAAL